MLTLSGDKPGTVFQVDVAGGRISTVCLIHNPDKLRSLVGRCAVPARKPRSYDTGFAAMSPMRPRTNAS
ncbi:hypothetical protein [Streptomyces sp. NPDC001340]